ncbi:MAG: class I tRNA ligase family protein, partial [Treponema sp.]|nr:class I tRNA ligase family protein [Treponema sp.]
MDAIELEKAYDPETFEARIYARWKEAGAFRPESAKGGGKPFSMVIPPPNVTGRLHLGHGLNNSLQDVIVRFHRMRGNPVLWLPGTDHAGIATQHVVERRLKAEGRSRVELGREKFVEESWKTTREHHAVICEQLARIGAGVDWDRERFTFDEGLARAVREVFVTLYERDLMYKGNYLVNWCSSCGTALADDEVNHEEVKGKLYRLRYYFAGPEGEAARQAVIRGEQPPAGTFIEIDTSRPETLFGDTAVAANPEDPRYVEFKGKTVILPIVGKEIPVVLDSFVDRDFGTGVLKITPAHAVGDWEVAGRQSLPVLNILNADGTLNDEVPPQYRGLSVNKARQEVAGEL